MDEERRRNPMLFFFEFFVFSFFVLSFRLSNLICSLTQSEDNVLLSGGTMKTIETLDVRKKESSHASRVIKKSSFKQKNKRKK